MRTQEEITRFAALGVTFGEMAGLDPAPRMGGDPVPPPPPPPPPPPSNDEPIGRHR